MAKKKPSARTARRTVAREAVKSAEAGIKLAALAVGGAADRPIVVTSASVIEPHASSLPCVACGESVRIDEHVANAALGLRIVKVRCPRCGVRRELYFRIAQPN